MIVPQYPASDELVRLAERVEALAGPDRVVDAEIMFALYAKPVGQRADGGPTGYLWPEDNPSWNLGLRFPGSSREKIIAARARDESETIIIERDGAPVLMNSLRIPNLTASLDATMTLVDPDDEWEISTLYNIARASVGLNRNQSTCWTGYGEHKGCDPALALLAAALRARALTKAPDHDR